MRPDAPALETRLDEMDRRLIVATQAGLPLVPEPYEAIGRVVGTDSGDVRRRLARMVELGAIRRIGAVPNHYALGYRANGMTVWDVDDGRIDALAPQIAALGFVSHCYRRPRRLPHWRYNLFAMVHGRDRAQVEALRGRIAALLGDACRAHDVLYSSRILKKTGVRLAMAGAGSPNA